MTVYELSTMWRITAAEVSRYMEITGEAESNNFPLPGSLILYNSVQLACDFKKELMPKTWRHQALPQLPDT